MKNFPSLCFSIAVLFNLAGCAGLSQSGPTPLILTLPDRWEHDRAEASAAPGNWWESFRDPSLTLLVETALARNNDLASAALTVRRAQLQAGLARDKLMPSLGASIASSVDRAFSGAHETSKSNAATVSLSYEVDLWGKLSRQVDMQQWESAATAQDLESTRLTLIGTTMNLYWKIVYLNRRLAISEQSLAAARVSLTLARVKREAGAVSQLDVYQAAQNLASQEAGHTRLLQQRVESRNALAILFDAPPENIVQEIADVPAQDTPAVAAGLPAALLGRRPDLRAAELRLRKSLTAIEASKASYYPALTLTNSLGGSSADLLKMLSNPVATLGANLALPFLQWKEMKLNVQISEVEHDKALIEFRQTVYKALGEVENSLSARTQYEDERRSLEQSLRSAQAAERIHEVQYRAGAVALKSWLDAQQTRRDAEVSLAENTFNRFSNQVILCQALGGSAFMQQ